jgi:hypothetical protein
MQTRTGIEKQNGEIFSQEHLHLIYGYVYSYMRTHQEAEDLTSQIFLKAVRRLDLPVSAQSFSTGDRCQHGPDRGQRQSDTVSCAETGSRA